MDLEILGIILAALTAFLTLITSAIAIGVTLGIIYFAKLKEDRNKEIKELVTLQNEFEEKIRNSGDGEVNNEELKLLKNDYLNLKRAISPMMYNQRNSGPTVHEMQVMINDLLIQVESLQKQLVNEKEIK